MVLIKFGIYFQLGKANVCQQLTASSSLRDLQWSSHNCTLTFQSVGVWPEEADGTDVNTICRNPSQTLLATGDDFGKVNIYRNPASYPNVSQQMLKLYRIICNLHLLLADPSALIQRPQQSRNFNRIPAQRKAFDINWWQRYKRSPMGCRLNESPMAKNITMNYFFYSSLTF